MAKIAKNTIIESKKQLIDDLVAAAKPSAQWLIGTEHEKIIYRQDDLSRPDYFGDSGIGALLNEFAKRYDWQAVTESDNIIALEDNTGANISLEPGGQLELSGAPLANLHQTCNEVHSHLHQTIAICEDLDLSALGIGFDPLSLRDDIFWMPKGRYKIMREYMPKKGNMGLDMMLRTCTVQVNIDFASEQDMIDKMRIAMAFQPLATALFANSPFKEGVDTGYQSLRAQVWQDTDPDRCGFLDFVFDDGFGFEYWVDYLCNIPMYFVKRDGIYHDMTRYKFTDLLNGQCHDDSYDHATYGDWLDHMTVAFPEVRLKHYIEMRGADVSSWGNICALPSFWVGLLYDCNIQQSCWDMVKKWSIDDIRQCYLDVPKLGLQATLGQYKTIDYLKEILDMSANGLKQRNIKNKNGDDERIFLKPLQEIVENQRSNSDILRDKFQHEWAGDIRKLYYNCRY